MPKTQAPPLTGKDPIAWLTRVARAVNDLLLGRTNNVHDVTLAAAAATTVISDARITPDTVAILTPLTANAALALATTYQTAAPGQITLNHAVAATTDRTFRVALFG